MEKRLREAYGELYDCVPVTKDDSGHAKAAADQNYVTFTAMQGHRYLGSKDIADKPFRLMLVGRAVNGWDEYRTPGEFTKDAFVETSIQNLKNAPNTVVRKDGVDRFEWISTSKNSAKNCARAGIDQGTGKIGNSHLTRSPLWAYTKDIWDSVYGKALPWENRWFEHIVWSNLYKVSPHDRGNPDPKLMRMQENACTKLLQAEIDYFDPTHILFVTGSSWFAPFKDIFINKRFRTPNCASGKNKNNIYVEGTADYITPAGTVSKVVVACRPELRCKTDYTKQVSEFLVGNMTIKDEEISNEILING